MSTTIRCAYCTRWRVRADVFWHEQDRKWYCASVEACEWRLYVLAERHAARLVAAGQATA